LAWALCVLVAGGAWAQDVGQEAQSAQFVLLLDDSGSMIKNDPNRLSIFAARSMLALFDDRDEISVVKLNGPFKGEPVDPLQPMREVRGKLEAQLANDAALAKFEGTVTPCIAAFTAIREKLNAVRRKGTRQVLLYLTDGACTTKNKSNVEVGDEFDADGWLRGVSSHKDGEFAAYVLRFKGQSFTKTLAELASKTGASTFEVSKEEATGIMTPFARALSQAQGFDAVEVTPQQPSIAAHSSARRVRLLAVAEGDGPALEVGFGGSAPKLLGAQRTGTHKYKDGKSYRFASVDYEPGKARVEVTVRNGGNGWKLIAIPEYRLRLVTSVRAGKCADAGESIQSIEVGGTACVQAKLLNDAGLPIDVESFGSRVDLVMDYRGPGASELQQLPLTQGGKTISGTLERVKLEAGDHVFYPRGTITFASGDAAPLRGSAFTLQAASTRMNSSLSRWDVGDLVPGDARSTELTLSGNFPKADGTFRLARPDGFPACVHLSLSGVEEGGTLPLIDGQKYTLSLRVDSLCSLKSFKRELQASVRVDAKGLPTLEIPLSATLDAQVTVPSSLEVEAGRAGATVVPLKLTGNHRGDIRLAAALGQGAGGWPKEELLLGFAAASADGIEPTDALGGNAELTLGQEGLARTGPRMWVQAQPCCSEGAFKSSLTLSVPGVEGESLTIPVSVKVAPGSWWGCYGRWVVLGVQVFLVLLVLWMLRNMWKNSHFIKVASWEGGKKRYEVRLPTARVDGVPDFEPEALVPGGPERFMNWLSCGGLFTAFGHRVFLETLQVTEMKRDSDERNVLWCRLVLLPWPLLTHDAAERDNARNELPKEDGIFLKAQVSGTAPTFVRVQWGERSITLFEDSPDGAETYSVQVDTRATAPTTADGEKPYQSIMNPAPLRKLGVDKKPAKKPAISILF
jgi:Mg-chelatase subunit ChlD